MMQKTVPNTMHQDLFDAAMAGDGVKIAALAAAGVDVACHDEHGRTCLHHAAQRGLAKSIVALIGAGADPNQLDAVGWPAINLAAYGNQHQAIAELVLGGAHTDIADDRQYLPIDLSVCQGWAEATLMLRGCGSPLPLSVADENNRFAEIFELPLLHAAVLCNNARVVALAMERSEDRGELTDEQIIAAAARAEQGNKSGPSAYLRSLLAQKAARSALDELGLEPRGVTP